MGCVYIFLHAPPIINASLFRFFLAKTAIKQYKDNFVHLELLSKRFWTAASCLIYIHSFFLPHIEKLFNNLSMCDKTMGYNVSYIVADHKNVLWHLLAQGVFCIDFTFFTNKNTVVVTSI